MKEKKIDYEKFYKHFIKVAINEEGNLCPDSLNLSETDICMIVNCKDCWKKALKQFEIK